MQAYLHPQGVAHHKIKALDSSNNVFPPEKCRFSNIQPFVPWSKGSHGRMVTMIDVLGIDFSDSHYLEVPTFAPLIDWNTGRVFTFSYFVFYFSRFAPEAVLFQSDAWRFGLFHHSPSLSVFTSAASRWNKPGCCPLHVQRQMFDDSRHVCCCRCNAFLTV